MVLLAAGLVLAASTGTQYVAWRFRYSGRLGAAVWSIPHDMRVWVAGGAVLLLMRSGNQPDIGVSDFETHLRGFLTTLLGARPRFKEFLLGFPALMLLPALAPAHRRAIGWIIIIAAGIGLSDVLDTFSHIHTPLIISVLRLFNGLVVGAVIGIAAQWLYRRLRAALPAPGP